MRTSQRNAVGAEATSALEASLSTLLLVRQVQVSTTFGVPTFVLTAVCCRMSAGQISGKARSQLRKARARERIKAKKKEAVKPMVDEKNAE
jgi:hypothetical protein